MKGKIELILSPLKHTEGDHIAFNKAVRQIMELMIEERKNVKCPFCLAKELNITKEEYDRIQEMD